ncbi:TIGR03086 family metal-binding protein [Paractinoplanes ferrugineus]|uniref:TIGR03086 family protein n=1 Tax=Paractinoplanes ferrugineus TaxID=113564 RepID=A0A919MCR4_9ACTN|nr:TIGR03086 family metal-binding protein [Actinoplanes ferrugineus]GIE10998.1 TIGR03086 family protein [Actinoplanes ferrugineus]
MTAALRAGVAVLERAVSYCLGSLSLVTPALLSNPTPCPGWDLGALLEHLIDSMTALHEAADTGVVRPSAPPPAAPVVPLARDRAVLLLGAWAAVRDDFTVRVDEATAAAPLIATAGAIELTAHSWDVSQACHRSRPIPPELADELLDLAVILIRPADRPGRFARPVPPPGDASPGDRLLAFLGRR